MPSRISERPFTWPEVQELIADNDLDSFARSESDHKLYIAFKSELKSQGMTVLKHMLVNTLGWLTLDEVRAVPDKKLRVPSSGNAIFTTASDLMVVKNDFPYYFEPDVRHLCVWSKKRIESDPNSEMGDILPETRQIIEDYVCKTFVEWLGIPRENIVWLRNWDALQSVKELSHIHVIVKGMSQEQADLVVGGPGQVIEY